MAIGNEKEALAQFMSETKKLVKQMLDENWKEWSALIKEVKEESGKTAEKELLAARKDWMEGSRATQTKLQSEEVKRKVAEGQIAALTREVEALKRDSVGSADIAALKKRLDVLEKKK